jgi:hypothetical protein
VLEESALAGDESSQGVEQKAFPTGAELALGALLTHGQMEQTK